MLRLSSYILIFIIASRLMSNHNRHGKSSVGSCHRRCRYSRLWWILPCRSRGTAPVTIATLFLYSIAVILKTGQSLPTALIFALRRSFSTALRRVWTAWAWVQTVCHTTLQTPRTCPHPLWWCGFCHPAHPSPALRWGASSCMADTMWQRNRPRPVGRLI